MPASSPRASTRVPARPAPPSSLAWPETRSVPRHEVASFLHALLGLTPLELPEARQPLITIDAWAWIEWALAGLSACAVPKDTWDRPVPWTPPYQTLETAGRIVAVRLAFGRCGENITHTAAALGTSRRVVRDALVKAGLRTRRGAS
jgi:hypothetical protein